MWNYQRVYTHTTNIEIVVLSEKSFDAVRSSRGPENALLYHSVPMQTTACQAIGFAQAVPTNRVLAIKEIYKVREVVISPESDIF